MEYGTSGRYILLPILLAQMFVLLEPQCLLDVMTRRLLLTLDRAKCMFTTEAVIVG